MYQALYRKYRPQSFDDVVGQMAVTQTLKAQLITGELSHAYLFTGSRGTGKTTCAKILAKAVNCENLQNGNPCGRCAACRSIDSGACMDVLEIDAASNNGVDNIRGLRDDAVYTPSQVKKRVYIIDEVHMLSPSAFNALLKIMEEPPEHLLFILATTELHKVPVTVLSRCQRFAFRRIGQEDIAARLQYVAYEENIDLTAGAARTLARMADGGMRDGLSLLDQCASATVGELTEERICQCLGIVGERTCGQMLACIAKKDSRGALELFDHLYAGGKDVAAWVDEMLSVTRDLLLMKTAPQAAVSMLSGVAEDKELAGLTGQFSTGELMRILELLRQTAAGFTSSAGGQQLDGEMCILSLCQPELNLDPESLNARLTRLEERIQAGFVPAPESPAPRKEPEVPPTVMEKKTVQEPVAQETATVGFWQDLMEAMRSELPKPVVGFVAQAQGVFRDGRLVLECAVPFVYEYVNTPQVLELAARKASALLGRPVQATAVDLTAEPKADSRMEPLIQFGRKNQDVITIHN